MRQRFEKRYETSSESTVNRVSTSNKILQEPQTAKAKQMEVAGDQHPATAAYSNATLSLKKMRERLTKAQLPNESAGKKQKALHVCMYVCIHAYAWH